MGENGKIEDLVGYSDTEGEEDYFDDDTVVENTEEPIEETQNIRAENTANTEIDQDFDNDADDERYDNDTGDERSMNVCNDVVDDDDELDDKVMQGFLKHLMQLQEQMEKKKKESRFLPCISNYMKLDFEQRSERISPTIIRHLLHVCRLILTNTFDNIKIDNGDRGVLEHITSKDCPKKDIKYTLVEDIRIHSYIRKAVRQLEDIKKKNPNINGRRSQTAKKSVKDNSSLAGNDIINYLRKADSYRKSVGLDSTAPDDGDDAAQAPPVTAGPSGAGHKPGTVAYAMSKIDEHFQKHSVKPTDTGIKTKDSTINISYQDMMEDLTRNYTQTTPNLTDARQRRVLLLLKKTNMPISYIRNKKMKEQYRQLLNRDKNTPLPLYKNPYATPQAQTSKTGKDKGKKKRLYLQDSSSGSEQ
ncbi:Hypothetical predicted protein [Paramuricea clavata]|uniref:Uncharacterized protein n=1 Tax=Paramuricea clavata TaxID=317549 RepID=A0A7D9D6W5_PARCT|nr:Hypothetical predicted protein [Paramuricea clavata]